MDTSDIQDQYVVDIDPHVVIAGEPEYHRISIRKDPLLRHAELGIHLHTCIEVRYSLDTVNVLIGSPIVQRQGSRAVLVQKFLQIGIHIDVVEHHEMPVIIVRASNCAVCSIRCGNLPVDFKLCITVFSQIGIVVFRTITERTVFIIIACEEKLRHAGLGICDRTAVGRKQAIQCTACDPADRQSILQVVPYQWMGSVRSIRI